MRGMSACHFCGDHDAPAVLISIVILPKQDAIPLPSHRDGKNGILENWNVGTQRLVQPVWVSSASCIFDFFLWPVPHWNAPPVSMLVGLIRSDSLSRVHEASVNYDTKPVCEAD